ncbi:MAG: hypothetical protein ACRCZY_02005 [Phocaeicola sp.]
MKIIEARRTMNYQLNIISKVGSRRNRITNLLLQRRRDLINEKISKIEQKVKCPLGLYVQV